MIKSSKILIVKKSFFRGASEHSPAYSTAKRSTYTTHQQGVQVIAVTTPTVKTDAREEREESLVLLDCGNRACFYTSWQCRFII